MVENPNGSNLLHQDLEQIHEDDLEAMDLKWQLSLLSMRAKRYFQRTGKKIFINVNDTAGIDKSKGRDVSNVTRRGTLAREKKKFCRAPRNKEGFNWSDMAEEQVQKNMALMAFSDSEISAVARERYMQSTYSLALEGQIQLEPYHDDRHGFILSRERLESDSDRVEALLDSGCWGARAWHDGGGSMEYLYGRSEMNRGGVEVGCDIGLNIDGGLRLRWMRGGLLDGYSDYGRAQFKIEVYNWSCQFWEICGSKVGQWLGVGRGQNYGLVGCRGGGGLMSTTKLNMWVAAIDVIQFWGTTTARTTDDGEVEITTSIDGQVKTITKASLRRHLKLEDSDGITSLPNTEIFEQLALIGFPQSQNPTQTQVAYGGLHFTSVDVDTRGAATTDIGLEAGQACVPHSLMTVSSATRGIGSEAVVDVCLDSVGFPNPSPSSSCCYATFPLTSPQSILQRLSIPILAIRY
ncbi:hypothetical protein Tco_0478247 [Tanacetum coccineum]